MSLKEQLKEIEKEQVRLAKRKQALAAKLESAKKAEKKLDELVKKSGFSTPKALIQALMSKYGISRISLKGSASSKAAAPAEKKTRRKRTRVTAELRDAVKKELKGGSTMSAVSKKFTISYPVVQKIIKGAYDAL